MGDPQSVTINNRATAQHTYDAIIIGSGISGGWAAKELCEKGLKTLLLERGRNVEHVKDYPTASLDPWDFAHRLQVSEQDRRDNPVQSTVYDESSRHFFVSDKEHPYIQEDRFHWIRGYQVGGRSLVWGRQTYRLSDLDFEANARDGYGVDWPIRYKDIAPWYDYVERFIGVSGRAEGIAHLPDSVFLPPMDMNCVETYFAGAVKARYTDRTVIHGRVANLSRGWNGRGPCHARNLCMRGCPFGGYFSSNSATLPAAALTGHLTLRPHSIVYELIYDEVKGRATGVRIIDELTRQTYEYYAKIIFLNASTIASTSILLQSVSNRFPNGFGNDSGQLGHYLMDHHISAGACGEYEGFGDQYYKGRRPTGIYIPRFRNINEATRHPGFLRGYGYQGEGERRNWQETMTVADGFGAGFKDLISRPGPWSVSMGAWGECLPVYTNSVTPDAHQKDKWGLPLVRIRFKYGPNEKAMRGDAITSAVEMLDAAGFKNLQPFDYDPPPGSAVHEMGTARMGRDPKTSVLNGHNQVHAAPNVFVTDGSCMPSGGCQNPSLTYMALTARACDFAVEELKKNNL